MNQGQSTATLKKEAGISSCVGWDLGAAKPAEYFVFDLNCGTGDNRDNGANCRGTGPLMRDKLKERKVTSHMFLCDISKKSVREAERKFFSPQLSFFEPMGEAVFIKMDNRLFVPTIPQRIRERGANPKTAQGIIIADPNGIEVPIAEIAECLKQVPLLSVAIHLCGLIRVRGCLLKHPEMPQMKNMRGKVLSLGQIFDTVNRNFWLVSEPFGGTTRGTGGHFLLFGSQSWLKEMVNMEGRPNMYPISSREGRAIIDSTDRIAEVA